MKDIRFRAFDKKDGEMVTDIWIAPHYGWLVLSDNDAMSERVRPERDQWVIMQYTGLKDSKGTDVYEGDIVKRESEIGVVRWDNLVARFRVYMDDAMPMPRNYPLWSELLEVIGNIYENPELIAK
jgi:uncharacterized phage protein (TIGR01671 family)